MLKGKCLFFAAALLSAFVLGACSDDSGSGDPVKGEFTVSAAEFDSTIKSVRDKPGEYVINLTDDLNNYPGINFPNGGVKITVKGTGSNTISWKYDNAAACPLFYCENGSHLVLENIKLVRAESPLIEDNEKWSLLIIGFTGGTIEIREGTILEEGNIDRAVWMDSGDFIMSGGEIKNSKLSAVGTRGKGSKLTITGGTLSDNMQGIELHNLSSNCKLTISAGVVIKDNEEDAISAGGTGNTINVSKDAIITGNGYDGVDNWGTGNTVNEI